MSDDPITTDTVTLPEAAELCGYSIDYLRTIRVRSRAGKMTIPFPPIVGRDVDRPGRPLLFSRQAVLDWLRLWEQRQAARNGQVQP